MLLNVSKNPYLFFCVVKTISCKGQLFIIDIWEPDNNDDGDDYDDDNDDDDKNDHDDDNDDDDYEEHLMEKV